EVPGLGLLDVEVVFDRDKHLGRPAGTALGEAVTGYEIHHGRVTRTGEAPLVTRTDGTGEGADGGHLLGTHWHGLFENDAFRRVLLQRVAVLAGRNGFRPAPDTSFAAARAAQLDLLGDLVERHLDTDAIEALISHGPPADLPFVATGSTQSS
ncbi:MAG: cobyric acid synthase CobQ, partial [Actinomycetota bacterium]|nr:cobyric acid synthase CobQ [Actinomycetota bacterium]